MCSFTLYSIDKVIYKVLLRPKMLEIATDRALELFKKID